MKTILLGVIALYSSAVLAMPISEVIDSVLAHDEINSLSCSKAVLFGKGKITEQQCNENITEITKKCKSEILPGLPSEIMSVEQAGILAGKITTRLFVCQVSYSLGREFVLTEEGAKFLPHK